MHAEGREGSHFNIMQAVTLPRPGMVAFKLILESEVVMAVFATVPKKINTSPDLKSKVGHSRDHQTNV